MSHPFVLGILGGGQLAKMSAQAAIRLGIDVAIMEKESGSPAGRLTRHEYVGWVDDDRLMRKFAQQCDVITLENEFVDHHRLELLEASGRSVLPASGTIALIQDKFLQKEALAKHGIPVPRFTAVERNRTFAQLAAELGAPFILKSRKMGYDGYGNALVRSAKELGAAVERLTGRHATLMAESFIDFRSELAVMVARTRKETAVYPVVETVQKHHICHTVIAPASVPAKTRREAEEIAVECVKAVKGYGLFGIEMFLAADGTVIVNEMAPRPHNSGHYTMEACVTSQFENHVRAVTGLPLGSTAMVAPAAVMINLLGRPDPQSLPDVHRTALRHPSAHLHVYGKRSSRIGRKMGHITLVGQDRETLLREAAAAERRIRL